MTTFTNSAEAEKYLSSVFEAGFADPATSSALAKSGVVLRMNLSEPDTVITVDLVEQEIHIGEDAPEPNMILTLSSATANRFWQGKVSVPLAVARSQIKVAGAMPKLLGLLPHAKALNKAYTARLAADGRTDLLA